MPSTLLFAGARHAVFETGLGTGFDTLETPRKLRLDGNDAGITERHVFSLTGLTPGARHRLEIDGDAPLDFATAPETVLLDIRNFGADPASLDNAKAIQAAIDACPVGGTVLFPAGRWMSAPLFLRSGANLHFEAGAVLKALGERARFPILPARNAGGAVLGTWEGEAADCHAALLSGIGAENIAITGAGVIDGGGAEGGWWRTPKARIPACRPRTIYLIHCRAITIAGVTATNSPSWTIHPLFSRDLAFLDLAVANPPDSPNTDGLNPEACQNVDIVGVRFSVGDDCIAIKSNKLALAREMKQASSGIRIRRCHMQRGHGGVVLGSECGGGIRDVTIERCRFDGTDRGLRIKTRRGRGRMAVIERIAMRHVVMRRVDTALVVNSFYNCDIDGHDPTVQSRQAPPVDDGTPTVRDITVEHVVASEIAHAAGFFLGLPENPITGLVVRDFEATYRPDAQPGPPDMADNLPLLRHAGLVLDNVVGPRIEQFREFGADTVAAGAGAAA